MDRVRTFDAWRGLDSRCPRLRLFVITVGDIKRVEALNASFQKQVMCPPGVREYEEITVFGPRRAIPRYRLGNGLVGAAGGGFLRQPAC